jgi:hypothetical protein
MMACRRFVVLERLKRILDIHEPSSTSAWGFPAALYSASQFRLSEFQLMTNTCA